MFPSNATNRRSPLGAVGVPTGLLLAGVLCALAAGCNSFTAQGKNAEGVRLFQQARYQEALQQFQEAVYGDPNNADGYYNMAATYHRLGHIENRRADLDRAEDLYHQCLDKRENHRDCYRGLAVLLTEEGRSEEAFRLLEGWADRAPSVADARIELARLRQEFGDVQTAKEHLVEAVAVEPNNARALAALGKIREDSGQYAQALRVYQQSLAHDQFQPEVATRVAALRSALGSNWSAAAPDASGTVTRGSTPLR